MARVTIVVLYRIEAGEFETCLTVVMSYVVYLTCEAIEASGVIGVVLLGLTLNMNRACLSVSAVHISEQTWQLLAYVANSLIFITVGVILLKTYSETDRMLSLVHSIPQLLLIYMILMLVRALMILIVHHLLKHIAYGFTWKDSIVTIWSGLRGSVSLVLALTLFNSHIKDKYQAEIMLIHTTAIVFLTCTGRLTRSLLSIVFHDDLNFIFNSQCSHYTSYHK
jgi:solute carrier family 9 (sodium/hydrogen exchanger), member 10/11